MEEEPLACRLLRLRRGWLAAEALRPAAAPAEEKTEFTVVLTDVAATRSTSLKPFDEGHRASA